MVVPELGIWKLLGLVYGLGRKVSGLGGTDVENVVMNVGVRYPWVWPYRLGHRRPWSGTGLGGSRGHVAVIRFGCWGLWSELRWDIGTLGSWACFPSCIGAKTSDIQENSSEPKMRLAMRA